MADIPVWIFAALGAMAVLSLAALGIVCALCMAGHMAEQERQAEVRAAVRAESGSPAGCPCRTGCLWMGCRHGDSNKH